MSGRGFLITLEWFESPAHALVFYPCGPEMRWE
jgi:hypothetical protein